MTNALFAVTASDEQWTDMKSSCTERQTDVKGRNYGPSTVVALILVIEFVMSIPGKETGHGSETAGSSLLVVQRNDQKIFDVSIAPPPRNWELTESKSRKDSSRAD